MSLINPQRFKILLILLLILSVMFLGVKLFVNRYDGFLSSKNAGPIISLSFADPNLRAISADPTSKPILVASVCNSLGSPLRNVAVQFSVKKQYGEMIAISARTNAYGECMAYFVPNDSSDINPIGEKISITASVYNKSASSSVTLDIVPVPVVLIHGYQSTGAIFANMQDFLSSNNITCIPFEYDSTEGIEKSASKLNSFLLTQQQHFLKKGILIKRFDIVSHSLGGLVSRYYTSSDYYVKRNNVRKLILLAVPNHGSSIALLAEDFFKDSTIRDLSPKSSLFTKKFPEMINQGLNDKLEVANIIAENDEVVEPESASLKNWGIRSDIFSLGRNIFLTSESISDYSFTQGSNHQSVLNNSVVFDKILSMLNSKLPNPKSLK